LAKISQQNIKILNSKGGCGLRVTSLYSVNKSIAYKNKIDTRITKKN